MRNVSIGEQWRLCDRCGFNKPMSHLIRQKGLVVCTDTCVDDLDVERRDRDVQRVLSTNTTEGADMRETELGMVDYTEWL